MMPDTSSYEVTVDGTTIQSHEWGDRARRPIVLLHGAASSHRTWHRLVPPLVDGGYRVVAPDLRGHGGSPRATGYPLVGLRNDVVGLLDALELDRVTLLGHSLGAHLATMVAIHQPSRVARLILEDPPVPPRRKQDVVQWSRATTAMLYLRGALRRGFDRRGIMSIVEQLRVPDPEWWTGLTAITAPTLIISGGPRSHIAPQWLSTMAQAMPACELTTIPVGHRIHSLAADRFQEIVVPFVTSPD